MANGNGNGKIGKGFGVAAVLLTWLSTLVWATWATSADRTKVMLKIESHDGTLEDHECRLRKLETIAADVRWIRDHLEMSE